MIMLTPKQIDELRSVDIRTIDKCKLTDVSLIKFDNSLPKDERMACVLELTKNPYCFRYGDMGVKIEFSDNAPPLQKTLTDFMLRKKSGL